LADPGSLISPVAVRPTINRLSQSRPLIIWTLSPAKPMTRLMQKVLWSRGMRNTATSPRAGIVPIQHPVIGSPTQSNEYLL
jgi:hypothetical protein